jgi:hemolysin activation/secretion protein
VNGSSLDVVPGFSLGSASRTFPVRGFAAGSESGIRATAASVEYRAPLVMPSQGLGLFPLFVDRASLTVFADAARASCPGEASPACLSTGGAPPTLASVGAELDIDAALQFDVPYRFRFGIAHPIRGAAYAGASRVSAFVTLGGTF